MTTITDSQKPAVPVIGPGHPQLNKNPGTGMRAGNRNDPTERGKVGQRDTVGSGIVARLDGPGKNHDGIADFGSTAKTRTALSICSNHRLTHR